jgi:Protein of unknown function (DUF402)
MSWAPGDVIVRREVWRERPWMGVSVIVVSDEPDLLATYLPEGASFAFPGAGHPLGPHPWEGRGTWEGHGVLMLQRPGESYAVWHFWDGPEREFEGWYVNLQEPFRRTAIGHDTQDLELDIWLPREGSWDLKDDHVLEDRIREGRFTPEQVAATRAEASRIIEDVEAGNRWWSDDWANWEPDPNWPTPEFPR